MPSPAIEVHQLSKVYRTYARPWHRLSEALLRKPRHRRLVALEDVSFDLDRGAGLAVVGENGAGKSTLLKILAGITRPSSGRLAVSGRIASILELGSGFHPEFSGRQNIVLNAAMIGLEEDELRSRMPSIIEFSELDDFIDQPVKTYSTGMAMRLGFAIATEVDPEVLIIDEALSVGDGYFQKKCMDRMGRFVAAGGTLLFCSHAMYYVSHFCQRALWLRNGRPEALGPVDHVVREYESYLALKQRAGSAHSGGEVPREALPTVRPARLTQVRVVRQSAGRTAEAGMAGAGEVGAGEDDAKPASPVYRTGDPLVVEVCCEAQEASTPLHVGIGVNRADGLEVASFSSFHDGMPPLADRQRHRLRLKLSEVPLVKGEFSLYVFLLDDAGLHVYDERVVPSAFRVASAAYRFGLVDVDHSWEVEDAAESGARLAHAEVQG